MKTALPISSSVIEAFCKKWGLREFALFGSILGGDFRADSDVDVMVTFRHDQAPTFDSWFDMIAELQVIFGRKVDLVERREVEASRNWVRRRHILEHAETVYAE